MFFFSNLLKFSMSIYGILFSIIIIFIYIKLRKFMNKYNFIERLLHNLCFKFKFINKSLFELKNFIVKK